MASDEYRASSYLEGSLAATPKDCEFFGISRELLVSSESMSITVIDNEGNKQTHVFNISSLKSLKIEAN